MESQKSETGIVGYRNLTQEEKDIMNVIKEAGNGVGEVIAALSKNPQYDQRWLSIGSTHIQQGFMAILRAVARPETFV